MLFNSKLCVENPLFHLKMHHECYFIQNYKKFFVLNSTELKKSKNIS